jgi:N-acetylneuraminic acid mutarotase
MNKHLFSALLLLFSISATSQDIWTEKKEFPGKPRHGAFSFSAGGKIYVGGGESFNTVSFAYEPMSDMWEYDPETDTWKQCASLPSGNGLFSCAFSVGDKGYALSDSARTNFMEYDPGKNSWRSRAAFPSARRKACAVSIGNKGYAGFGINTQSNSLYADLWEYDPAANIWTEKAPFPAPGRIGTVAFSLPGVAYFGCGTNGQDYYKDIWQYDPSQNVWRKKPDFNGNPRAYAFCFSIGFKAYVGAGLGKVKTTDLWEYDPANERWTKRAEYPGIPFISGVSAVAGNRAYCGTGKTDGDQSGQFWEYSPLVIPPMARFRISDSAVCVNDSVFLRDSSGNNPEKWLWRIQGGSVSLSTGKNTGLTFKKAGQFEVKLIVSNSAGSDSSSKLVTVSSADPVLPDLFEARGLHVPVQLSFASPAGGTYTGKGIKDNVLYPREAGPGKHSVTYTYTSPEGCTATVNGFFLVKEDCGTGSGYIESDIYPNPGKGRFYICPHSELAGVLRMRLTDIRIYNSLGIEVFNSASLNRINGYEYLDLSGFERGLYYLSISTREKTYSRKLMLED